MDEQKPKPTAKTEISFRPVTDGLGFHPFSDGLPYAPIGKSSANPPVAQSQGTGAVAAGSPQFSPMVRKSVPQVSVPVARVETVQKKAPSPSKVQSQTLSLGRYYLLKRCLAYLFDTTINLGICGAALSALFWTDGMNDDIFMNPSVLIVAGIFLLILNWLLITFQEVVFSTSIGKQAFRFRLRNHGPLVLLRSILFIPSIGLFGVGLVWSLFDSKKRCWHDLLVGIQPYELTKL